MEHQLQQMASSDVLTGLANRRILESQLKHVIVSNARTQKSRALLFIDLDHFKTRILIIVVNVSAHQFNKLIFADDVLPSRLNKTAD